MLTRGCEWAKIQRQEADSMTEAWSEAVPRWREMLLAFKRSKSSPNPFEEPDTGMFGWVCTYSPRLNDL